MNIKNIKRWGIKTVFEGVLDNQGTIELELDNALPANFKGWGKDLILYFTVGTGWGDKLTISAPLNSAGIMKYDTHTKELDVHP